MVPRLTAFNALHVNIDVRIKAVDQPENSFTKNVDVAIYYGRNHWPNIHAGKLPVEYIISVCSLLLAQDNKMNGKPALLSYNILLQVHYCMILLEGIGNVGLSK